jgi:hypothetical protein
LDRCPIGAKGEEGGTTTEFKRRKPMAMHYGASSRIVPRFQGLFLSSYRRGILLHGAQNPVIFIPFAAELLHCKHNSI